MTINDLAFSCVPGRTIYVDVAVGKATYRITPISLPSNAAHLFQNDDDIEARVKNAIKKALPEIIKNLNPEHTQKEFILTNKFLLSDGNNQELSQDIAQKVSTLMDEIKPAIVNTNSGSYMAPPPFNPDYTMPEPSAPPFEEVNGKPPQQGEQTLKSPIPHPSNPLFNEPDLPSPTPELRALEAKVNEHKQPIFRIHEGLYFRSQSYFKLSEKIQEKEKKERWEEFLLEEGNEFNKVLERLRDQEYKINALKALHQEDPAPKYLEKLEIAMTDYKLDLERAARECFAIFQKLERNFIQDQQALAQEEIQEEVDLPA